MIIHYRSSNTKRIEHSERTVRDFIDNIIMKTHSKENKYFHICVYPYANGKGNLIMYFQDGKLKSHHDTMCKFDYNEVLDCEILQWYELGFLCVESVHSVEYDDIEEFQAKLNEKETKFSMKRPETIMEKLDREAHEEDIRNSINKNDISYTGLLLYVKQLGKDFQKAEERNRDTAIEVRCLKEKNEILTQKIRWIGEKIKDDMECDMPNKLIEINIKLSEENGAKSKEIEYLKKEVERLNDKLKKQEMFKRRV